MKTSFLLAGAALMSVLSSTASAASPVSDVPEPGTFVLLGCGLVVLGLLSGRFRRR